LHNANDAKTFLKHFSDTVYFISALHLRTA